MTEVEKLERLRERLLETRRRYTNSILEAPGQPVEGRAGSFAEIQAAIDAVDRAISDEKKLDPASAKKTFAFASLP